MASKIFLIFFLFFSAFASSPLVQADKIKLPFGDDKASSDLKHLPVLDFNTLKEEKYNKIADKNKFEGYVILRGLVDVVGNFLMPFIAVVAGFMLFYAGYSLVVAQEQASEEWQKQKMQVVYVLLGLVFIALAGPMVYNYIYLDEGNALLSTEGCFNPGGSFISGANTQCKAIQLARESAKELIRIINLFLSFSGVGAILVLVISGIRLILDPGSEENIEKHKKVVAYTAVGIIIIGLANTLVNDIIFPDGGYAGPNLQAFNLQLRGLSNYILGFLGAFIFVAFVISGVLMVVNQGDEEMWSKIKTTMKNILIGVTVIFSAYTIVATLIRTLIDAGGGG